MSQFISFADPIQKIIETIMTSNFLHVRWLNTLSYLENCGARKIAACEHPTKVQREMLQHAAEEFRHAHYLKSQIERISTEQIEDYSISYLLGGKESLHYLSSLDLQTCRFLKSKGLSKNSIREAAYLLVTYAIELRASELYSIYDVILRKRNSPVTVKSIVLEEKEHLNEMIDALSKFPNGLEYAQQICSIESELCSRWLTEISQNFLPSTIKLTETQRRREKD